MEGIQNGIQTLTNHCFSQGYRLVVPNLLCMHNKIEQISKIDLNNENWASYLWRKKL